MNYCELCGVETDSFPYCYHCEQEQSEDLELDELTEYEPDEYFDLEGDYDV